MKEEREGEREKERVRVRERDRGKLLKYWYHACLYICSDRRHRQRLVFCHGLKEFKKKKPTEILIDMRNPEC